MVGNPVEVKKGEVEEQVQRKYIDALIELFEQTKPPGYKLEIV